jgi:hypothetical protein
LSTPAAERSCTAANARGMERRKDSDANRERTPLASGANVDTTQAEPARGVDRHGAGGGSVLEYWTWADWCQPALRAERSPSGR